MRIVGRIIGVILMLAAIPLFVLAACNTAVDTTLRAPETYADVLANDAIFEDLLPVALPAIMQAAAAEGIDSDEIGIEAPIQVGTVTSVLEAEEWREVTNLLVSPTWLQERTNQLVNAMLSVINGDADVINEPFDLTDLRQRLTGDEAQQAAELILNSAPECTQTESDRIRTFVVTESGELPICNPADAELRQDSLNVLTAWFADMATALETDTPTVGEFMEMDGENARGIYVVFELLKQGLVLLYLCPTALLALVVIVTIRSVKGIGRWFGIAFIIAGLGLLLILIMTQLIAFNVVSEFLNASSELDVFMGRIGSEAVRAAFANASGTMLGITGFYIAIGFILLVVSWIITRDDDDEGEMVLISDTGEIISTASQKRIGQISEAS
jgi:hypothetical protein